MIKRFFLIPLFCFMLFPALAQTDCNNYLDRASLMYREGRFTEAITVLKACAPADANEVNKWKVSRLLCQCYLGLNDIVAAKASAEDMLDKNPLYKPSLIEDSKEFVNLIKSVSVVPRFSLSLSFAAGLNISFPKVINSYTISTYTKNYKNGKAQQIGLFAGYNINKRLGFNAGVHYIVNNYSLEYTIQKLNFKYSESLNYLQTHLFARYQVKAKGDFKVFVQAGGWSGFLIQSKYSISQTDSNGVKDDELLRIDATSIRNDKIFGVMGGVGISYKLGEGHVFAEMNYQNSFSKINNPEKRIDNQNLIYRYYFIDDDLSINNLTFSLGYTFYLNYFVEHSKSKK